MVLIINFGINNNVKEPCNGFSNPIVTAPYRKIIC